MGKFFLGIVVTLVVLLLGGLGLAILGFLPTRANVAPPHWERHIAMTAVDRSMERHAPRQPNPVQPTDQNLEDGMKLYTMNCAVCHGGLDRKPASLANSFYPPAPNLVLDPPDDPEWRTAYTIRTGIRYTGMPAWDKTLSEENIWKITALLSRLEKLPPTVQDFYKNSFGVAPGGAEGEKKEDDSHPDHDHH